MAAILITTTFSVSKSGYHLGADIKKGKKEHNKHDVEEAVEYEW